MFNLETTRQKVIFIIILSLFVFLIFGFFIVKSNSFNIQSVLPTFLQPKILGAGTITGDASEKFTSLKENNEGVAVFTLDTSVEKEALSKEAMTISFNEVHGKVKSYKIYANETCTRDATRISGTEIVRKCYWTYIDKDGKEIIVQTKEEVPKEFEGKEVCKDVEQPVYETYQEKYDCFNEVKSIPIGVNDYKIVADIEWASWIDKEGKTIYGYQIDWIPKLVSDGVSYEKVDWAWWNASYAYRNQINCTLMADNVPLVINGSSGFTLGGYNQIVWTYCRGNNTYLYYNNYSNYVVANETTQLPMEIEFGNMTSYTPTSVWDSNYKAVYHMNGTSTTINDSTSNGKNGTKLASGEPAEVNGKIGKAQSGDGSNDYISLGTASAMRQSSAITYDFWAYYNGVGGNSPMGVGGQGGQGYGGVLVYPTTFYYHWTPTTPASDTALNSSGSWGSSWHHFVFTMNYATGSYAMYVDGVAKTTSITQAVSSYAPTTYFSEGRTDYLNARYVNSLSYWNGSLDEIRISNTPRSATYINQTYQNAMGTLGFGTLSSEENHAPVMVSSRISSVTNTTADNLTGYCNATDIAEHNVSYYYNWYKNGGLNTSGVTSQNYTQSQEINIANLSSGNLSVGQNWSLSCIANDLTYNSTVLSSVNTTIIQGAVPDLTAPNWSSNSTNSTLAQQAVSHRLYWNDSIGLKNYIFSFDNGTGTFVNDSVVTFTGTSNWSNVTKVVNSTVGSTIRWCVYANDTSDNMNSSSCASPFTYTTTSAIDTSFIVTLPLGTTQAEYTATTKSAQAVAPTNQTDSVPFFNITNTGNTNLNLTWVMNESLPASIELKADTDNNPTGAKQVNTTAYIFKTGLTSGSSFSIWFWSYFTDATPQTIYKKVNVSTVQE